jgi:hypothetical protein
VSNRAYILNGLSVFRFQAWVCFETGVGVGGRDGYRGNAYSLALSECISITTRVKNAGRIGTWRSFFEMPVARFVPAATHGDCSFTEFKDGPRIFACLKGRTLSGIICSSSRPPNRQQQAALENKRATARGPYLHEVTCCCLLQENWRMPVTENPEAS